MLYGSWAFNANISGSSIPVTISNKQHQNLAEFNHFINTYWVYFFSNKQYLISFLWLFYRVLCLKCNNLFSYLQIKFKNVRLKYKVSEYV